MGAFHCMCAESGLIVTRQQRLIVIREIAEHRWVPIAAPIAGSPDGYGQMDVPKRLDTNMKAVLALGTKLDYGDRELDLRTLDLETMIDNIQGDGGGPGALTTYGTQDGHRISYALVYGPVYEAIVGAVKKNGATAWRRFAQVSLGAPELPLPHRHKTKSSRVRIDPMTKRLAEAVLASPDDDGTRKVLVDHLLEREDPYGKLLAILPVAGKLSFDKLAELAFPAGTTVYDDCDRKPIKPALVEFVRFLAWGTRWSPTNDENRITGYRLRHEHDDAAAEPYVVRARTKYREMPELLAACDANERTFREIAIDTEHDIET